jgi:hypothetical protein
MTRELAILSAKAQIQDAYGVLRTVLHQQNASKIRETFLEDRAERAPCTSQPATRDGGVTKQADAICQLIIAAEERSSSIFKCLGIWLKGTEYVTMDRILVPDDPNNLDDTTWSSIIEARSSTIRGTH